jgi:hypothetical protein
VRSSGMDECRVAAAKRSPVHKRVGWHLDKFTAARIRLGAIWRRHPEFTAEQVIRRLGPKYAVRLPWVQKVMKECWRASGKHGPEQWRIGPRSYHSSSVPPMRPAVTADFGEANLRGRCWIGCSRPFRDIPVAH